MRSFLFIALLMPMVCSFALGTSDQLDAANFAAPYSQNSASSFEGPSGAALHSDAKFWTKSSPQSEAPELIRGSSILKVESFDQVRDVFEQCEWDCMAVFDVDQVLVTPTEPAFRRENMSEHKAAIKKVWGCADKDKVFDQMIRELEFVLLDEEAPAIIAELQNRNIPTIALTGASAVGDRADNRHNLLRKVGIDFSKAFEKGSGATVAGSNGLAAQYDRGVLFANSCKNDKGEVLVAFFEQMGYTPKRVVFIDDTLDNVVAVEKALAARGIDHIGLHFVMTESDGLSAEYMEEKWGGIISRAMDENFSKI